MEGAAVVAAPLHQARVQQTPWVPLPSWMRSGWPSCIPFHCLCIPTLFGPPLMSLTPLIIPTQTLEMLTKRAGLLEKKVKEQMDKARQLTKDGNKRGEQRWSGGMG